MQILWLNHRDPKHPLAGGSELHLIEVGKRLVHQGHTVDVVCEKAPNLPKHEVIDGVNFHRLGGRIKIHLLAPMKCLKNRFSHEYDVIIDDIAHAFPWFSPIFARNVVAIVHHIHAVLLFRELKLPLSLVVYLAEKLLPLVYRFTPMIVVSESTKQNLIQMKLPEKKLHVIFNGVDDAVYKLLMEKSPNPLVLYLGRIMKYKNIDHLIEIFSSTSRRIENSRMIIVGTGPELENIRRLVKDSDLEDKILVRGYVSLEEKIELLNHAWVIVSASMREGWSLTAIEAAACGTPTVAYNVLGLRDSVRDGETGLLVPYGDKSRFAEVLIKILTDPTLRARLSENALNWSNNYRWDVAAKAFLEVCESATSPKHI